MDIASILKYKYSDIDLFVDVGLRDDGNGAYIERWNREEPKPTQKDLDKWAIDFADEYTQEKAKEEFKQRNEDVLKQLDEVDFKSIRAIREADQERIDELEAEAVALRAQLQ